MPRLLLLAALLLPWSAFAAERVVTLAPHLAELVCTAGACQKLVGTVLYTDYPPEARRRPLIGDALNINYEELIALKPDLVLAWDGGTSPEVVRRLRGLGLRVEEVRIRTLRDVGQALARVGDLTGSTTSAGFAANLYYRRLEKLRNAHWQKPKLRVMYQIESDPVYTISERSPISEAIKLCGGVNVFAELRPVAATVSYEAVLAANPDVVVYAQQDDAERIRDLWSRWPETRAQQAGNLYSVDANLLARQSPRMLDGVEQLCAVLDRARERLAYSG
jgi:iron complex transport system substrate-binding protein